MRVIIASSRDYPERTRVHNALLECTSHMRPGQLLTVVHGHSRKGADAAADAWAWWAHRAGMPVNPPERHPAQWSAPCRRTCPRKRTHRRVDPRGGHTVCPIAGYYRNEQVAALGGDLCLAFVLPGDPAGDQMVRVCRDAGIDVIPFPIRTIPVHGRPAA